MDEIDKSFCFCLISFDKFLSQHRLEQVRESCNKKVLTTKLFQLCDSKTGEPYMLKYAVLFPKQNLIVYSTNWVSFSKPLIKHASLGIELPKP